MKKEVKPTNVLISSIGGLFGFLFVRYLGITPLVPLFLISITFSLTVFIHNKLEQNEANRARNNLITKWRFLCSSILIGHTLWMILGFIFLFAQGLKPNLDFFVAVLMGTIYLSCSACLLKIKKPRISTFMTIIVALFFLVFNLMSLNEIRNQAFAPLIYLHSIVRLVLIISSIRLLWLMDVDHRMKQYEKDSDDNFNVA
ncbi:hypothetical protein [Halobacteriovorax sp. DA5]|uniref:hypothetical protein n=1 Tax=Halobacteriovorax sp. DA5 TaxID=2067553 RepID=UPI000CD061A1|nr:hypothetical protein [Halobacteriovorax sp. DA5]POB14450.1 hypothetical protein C0Z22_04985 [Halobacteriovorax sp. DA5]